MNWLKENWAWTVFVFLSVVIAQFGISSRKLYDADSWWVVVNTLSLMPRGVTYLFLLSGVVYFIALFVALARYHSQASVSYCIVGGVLVGFWTSCLIMLVFSYLFYGMTPKSWQGFREYADAIADFFLVLRSLIMGSAETALGLWLGKYMLVPKERRENEGEKVFTLGKKAHEL